MNSVWPHNEAASKIQPVFNLNPQQKGLPMKKLFVLLALIASATPLFAQVPGFHSPVPPRSMYRQSKPIFKTEPPPSYSANRGASPSSGMAGTVAATGAIAATLRMLEELSKPPTVPVVVTPPSSDTKVVLPPELNKPGAPPVIVVPADTGVTSVHVIEMEPVVKHPVPITIVPMDIMSVP